jgi:PA domain-containing protein
VTVRASFRALLLTCLALTSVPAHAAHILVHSVDPPGTGLEDPRPVAPVGNNPGTTLGEQRRIALEVAARLWGERIPSDVTIVVQATFQPLFCLPFGGLLGSAAPISIYHDFPGAPLAQTWYPSALANRFAGVDLSPGPPDPGFLEPPFNDDIYAIFNSALDDDPGCLEQVGWYYGLDEAETDGVDVMEILMHELAHGLGFQNFIDETTGQEPDGLPDVYATHTFDTFFGKSWNELFPTQIQQSAHRSGGLVWNGPHVRAQAPDVLERRPALRILAPGTLAGEIEAQGAFYGPALEATGPSGPIVLAKDGTGVPTDGCQPLIGDYTGAVVMIDRGTCSFAEKTLAAQRVGAVGVVVANIFPTGFPPMGGDPDPTIVIPSIGIRQADAQRIVAALPGVVGEVALSHVWLQGADNSGLMRLYAPNPVQPGSSIAHWDVVAAPPLLMQPFLDELTRPLETVDLTSGLLADIGWDACPDSDFRETVMVGACDSGVHNRMLDAGCSIADVVHACESGSTHGAVVRCVAGSTAQLMHDGFLDGPGRGKIQACVARRGQPAKPE